MDVAEHHDLPRKQLGLSHETRKLDAEPAAEVIQEMRRKIRDGAPAARTMAFPVSIPAAKWAPAAITGGRALFILLVWLLVR